MTNKLKAWLPALLWMALIFYMSSRPAIPTSDIYWQDFTLKKLAHFVEYFILAIFVYRAIRKSSQIPPVKIMVWTILICSLYAASDEIHQSLVPGRGPHVRDVVIDIFGASVGAFVYKTFVIKSRVD